VSLIASTGRRSESLGPRLSSFELMRHGRAYLAQHGLPTDVQGLALEVGYTLALVGPSSSWRESLRERFAVPDKPEPEPQPEKRKRPWGQGRKARLELRLSPEEREAFAAVAETRGVSVAEYVRDAAAQRLAEARVQEKRLTLRPRPLGVRGGGDWPIPSPPS